MQTIKKYLSLLITIIFLTTNANLWALAPKTGVDPVHRQLFSDPDNSCLYKFIDLDGFWQVVNLINLLKSGEVQQASLKGETEPINKNTEAVKNQEIFSDNLSTPLTPDVFMHGILKYFKNPIGAVLDLQEALEDMGIIQDEFLKNNALWERACEIGLRPEFQTPEKKLLEMRHII